MGEGFVSGLTSGLAETIHEGPGSREGQSELGREGGTWGSENRWGRCKGERVVDKLLCIVDRSWCAVEECVSQMGPASCWQPPKNSAQICQLQKRVKSQEGLPAGMVHASSMWLGRLAGGRAARYLELLEHELLHVEDLLLGVGVVADVDKIPHLGGVNLLVF